MLSFSLLHALSPSAPRDAPALVMAEAADEKKATGSTKVKAPNEAAHTAKIDGIKSRIAVLEAEMVGGGATSPGNRTALDQHIYFFAENAGAAAKGQGRACRGEAARAQDAGAAGARRAL